MMNNLSHQNGIAEEMAHLYEDARTGKISAKDAERLSRLLRRLSKLVPTDASNAKLIAALSNIE